MKTQHENDVGDILEVIVFGMKKQRIIVSDILEVCKCFLGGENTTQRILVSDILPRDVL